MDQKELVTLRPFEETDKHFVLKTWLRGLFYSKFRAIFEGDPETNSPLLELNTKQSFVSLKDLKRMVEVAEQNTPKGLSVFYATPFYNFETMEDQPGVFYGNYPRLIEAALSEDGARVAVACLKDTPDVILGYAALNSMTHTLHWVFVKPQWRKIGIARMLIPDTVRKISHYTPPIGHLMRKKDLEFNPF